jgi:aldose 1-epimerase
MEAITLRCGPLGVVLAPPVGGSIARFWSETSGRVVELLRPAPAEGLPARDPWHMASFPLVPWSNRIRAGRFSFAGRVVAQDPNYPPEPHVIHGHGWAAAWTVVDQSPAATALEYRHDAGAWPWAYRAVQRIALSAEHLMLELRLTNESGAPMPAGLGWHPYVPRTAATTLSAEVGGCWLTDAEAMPTALVKPLPARDPSCGLPVDRVALDNVFTGWTGRAVVDWPEHRARLAIEAGPPLDHLVIYTPPGRAFFCVEPVSHVTDAFNLAAAGRTDTGTLVLAPGETVNAWVRLTPGAA